MKRILASKRQHQHQRQRQRWQEHQQRQRQPVCRARKGVPRHFSGVAKREPHRKTSGLSRTLTKYRKRSAQKENHGLRARHITFPMIAHLFVHHPPTRNACPTTYAMHNNMPSSVSLSASITSNSVPTMGWFTLTYATSNRKKIDLLTISLGLNK